MKRLLSLLGVRPEEWPRLRWMVLYSVAFGLSKVSVITAGNTLFLDAFGAAAFPFLYMASAVMMPLLILTLRQVEKRLSFGRYLAGILGSVLVLIVALRLGLAATAGRWLLVAIALSVEIVYTLGSIAFWGLAARLFDVREAKRLTGLIGAGEVLAIAAGGLMIPAIVARVETADLLLFTAAAVAVSLASLSAIARTFPERLRVEGASTAAEQPADPAVASGSYRRLIFSVSVFLIFAYYFADNMFYERLETRFDDPGQMAAFTGRLFGVAALLTFGARLIAGRLMVKLGLVFGLMVEPVLLAAATLALVAAGLLTGAGGTVVFWIVMVVKVLERVTLDGFTRGAGIVMLQPLPVEERARVHAFRLGVVEAIGGGVAGAALWLLIGHLGLSAVPVGAVLLLLMLGWLGVNWLVSSAYLEALTAALSKRVLGGGELRVDRSSLELIEGRLASKHPGEVLYALELVATHEPGRLPALSPALLEHPAPVVRRRALELIAERQVAAEDPVRERIAGDLEPAVRGDAVRTLIAIAGDEVFEEILPHLESDDPERRRGALVGLLESGSIEGIMAAGETFLALQRSGEPEDRAYAARVIGEVGLGTFYRPLLELLDDPSPQVRKAALTACRRVSNPRLWPKVIDNLTGPHSAPEAVLALRGAGETALPGLERAFERPGLPAEVRVQLARATGHVPGAGAEELLWRHREHPDPEVRHGILAALAARGFRAGDRHGDVVACIRRETGAVAAACGILAGRPAGGGEDDLLATAVHADRKRCGERVLLSLSSIYPADAISRVRASLAQGGDQRAYAIELLDNLLDADLKPEVLPLFEPLEPAERRERLESARAAGWGTRTAAWMVGRGRKADRPEAGAAGVDELDRLAAGDFDWPSPWTRACALDLLARRPAAAEAGGDELRRRLEAGTEDASPLVRETARHHLAWLAAMGAAAERQPPTLARAMLLRRVAIFAETPDRHLAAVAALAHEIGLEAGTTFIHEGEEEHDMYVVVAGRVRVHDGDFTLAELGPGDSAGEMEAIDSEPRSASVTTLTAARLLRIEQAPLQQILAERPEVTRGILRVLVRRLRQLG